MKGDSYPVLSMNTSETSLSLENLRTRANPRQTAISVLVKVLSTLDPGQDKFNNLFAVFSVSNSPEDLVYHVCNDETL